MQTEGVLDDEQKQMLRVLAATLAAAFVLPAAAQAAGGDYVFAGASATERSTVRAALNAMVQSRTGVAVRVSDGDRYEGIVTLELLSKEIS